MSKVLSELNELNQKLDGIASLLKQQTKVEKQTAATDVATIVKKRRLKFYFFLEIVGGLCLFISWVIQNGRLSNLQDKEYEFIKLEAADLAYNSILASLELGIRNSDFFAQVTNQKPWLLEDSVYYKYPSQIRDQRNVNLFMRSRLEYCVSFIHASNRVKEIRVQVLNLNEDKYPESWLAEQLRIIGENGELVSQYYANGDLFKVSTMVEGIMNEFAYGQPKDAIIESKHYLNSLRSEVHGTSSWFFWLYILGAVLTGTGFLISKMSSG